jgi:chorismate synthase
VSGLLRTATNHAGGTLGGISNGNDVVFRVAIKPVSTIGLPQVRTKPNVNAIRCCSGPFSGIQTTATFTGESAVLEAKGRHDSCVLPRATPLVEGMAALVLADAALMQRSRGPIDILPTVSCDDDDVVCDTDVSEQATPLKRQKSNDT